MILEELILEKFDYTTIYNYMTNCGNACNPNTLYLNMPSSQGCTNDGCGQGLNNAYEPFNNPVAFCAPGKLGPRKNRDKVREQIKTYVLAKMGAPIVKIEATDQQLDIAIDFAMQVFEDYAGREYYQYYLIRTTAGKSIYTLPPDVGLVRNVFYNQQPNFMFNGTDVGGSLPLEYYYPGGSYASFQGGLMDPNQPIYGRAGEWVLYKQYQNMYSKLSSFIGGWEFIGGLCAIKIYPVPCQCSTLIVHYLQKRPDWKEVNQAMMEGALAHFLEMVARARSKYTNIPGPSGGVQLDGASMLQEALQRQKDWEERLINRFGDYILPITMY